MKRQLSRRASLVGAALALTCTFGVVSCNEEKYLNVSDPGALSSSTFPVKLADMDLSLIDLYGRLRFGFYSDQFRYIAILPDHTADMGYNGSGFNEYAEIRLQPGDGSLGYYWNVHNEGMIRCNNFLMNVEKLRPSMNKADQEKLAVMEGQARFIRAMHYFLMESLFGETMIQTDADRAKMGIPLWDGTIATTVAEAARARATVGEVWDFIINDLTKSAALLKGVKWDDANKPRVTEWAAKALLGKAYVFTKQYAKGRDVLKDVIDNSGKKLVDFQTLSTLFNGMNEFSDESLFEVNMTPDRKDIWNTQLNTSTQYGIFISPSYLEDNGKDEGTNGFGNLFIHDRAIDRFGFGDQTTATEQMKTKAYFDRSVKARTDKTIDPRMLVGTLQPWVDSIFVYDKWRKVTKNRAEGFVLTDNKAFNHRKYVLLDRGVWQGNSESLANNFLVLRMGDVMLLYAEALKETGNTAGALEALNMVHRRAYNVPVNAPSRFDYKTLTDKTATVGAGDHLANDPLKYERWAELFAEGHWWLDVCRWKIGDKEAAYFQKVKSGNLIWNDRKYSFPIPQDEMLGNPKMKQNPGY
jgi:starch-binding outer membrane protein, SusD/RagB family